MVGPRRPTRAVTTNGGHRGQQSQEGGPQNSRGATWAERASITIACIAPLALIHLLLTAPYMSLAAAYTLFSARTAAWNWDAPLASLMIWLRASLYPTRPGVKSLPPLEIADHIKVGRQALQRQLVPRITTGPATPDPTYIVHQAQQATQTGIVLVRIWQINSPYHTNINKSITSSSVDTLIPLAGKVALSTQVHCAGYTDKTHPKY